MSALQTFLLASPFALCLVVQTMQAIAADVGESPCKASRTCRDCLLQGPLCTWCYKPDLSSQRCDTLERHELAGCGSSVANPASTIIFKKNETVRNADAEQGLEALQISPQRIQLQLSPGRSVKFPVTFRLAEDYPVDLYYIMDLSYSMKDDQEKLIVLGQRLARELEKISKNVQLGFGAFVDKPVMPFAGTRPGSIENPCAPREVCKPTYSFINRLSLTNNTSIFGDKVRRTPISGNQDGPEGGLDALLQSMVCQKEIGWRRSSRKIILYSTDAESHIAADAKLAGILEPNDGLCHLKDDKYTYALKQDYPSVSQIASIARNTSTSIIFAVSQFTTAYQLLSKSIPNSVVGRLESDSSNIVTLIQNEYNKLVQTVALEMTGLPHLGGEIKLVLRSNCTSRVDGKMVKNNQCDLEIGETVHFEAEVSLESCASFDMGHSYSFEIKPRDLSDSIRVDVEALCECDCNDKIGKSMKCSGSGTYHCAVCTCDADHRGDICECDKITKADHNTTHLCTNPRAASKICSGRGECNSCGKCRCDCLPGELEPGCARFSGNYCECNPKGCHQRNGKICSGQGECACDTFTSTSYCQCAEGYEGEDCACPVADVKCRPTNGTGDVCNGKGSCRCGQCQCTDACYEGRTCSILKPKCSRSCINFRECVSCYSRGADSPSAAACSSSKLCRAYDMRFVSQMDTDSACFRTDVDNCRHYYRYEYNHTTTLWVVSILRTPHCQKDYWLEVIIGVCVGVLLLGVLALIIWKTIVSRHDSREVAKFLKETQQAKWQSTNNPIYKPATSTYKNPMYNGVPAACDEPQDL